MMQFGGSGLPYSPRRSANRFGEVAATLKTRHESIAAFVPDLTCTKLSSDYFRPVLGLQGESEVFNLNGLRAGEKIPRRVRVPRNADHEHCKRLFIQISPSRTKGFLKCLNQSLRIRLGYHLSNTGP